MEPVISKGLGQEFTNIKAKHNGTSHRDRMPHPFRQRLRQYSSQLCLEGPTDGYVQFISKLDRKHCRMLIELLTGHINLQYMLHKMRRAKIPSCRRCGAEKETSVHILCECPVLEKVRMQTLGCTRMDPEQIRGEAERDYGPW